MSAGQTFTKTIRKNMSIGPRTKRFRNGENMHIEIVRRVRDAACYPSGTATDEAIRVGYTAVNAYMKHIEGYRLDPVLCSNIRNMSPWAFTAFLGELVDSGVSNMAEAEIYFGSITGDLRVMAA